MDKITNKLWLAIVLVFVLNCANVSDASGDFEMRNNGGTPATNIKIDTLCGYTLKGYYNIGKTHVFQNKTQLTTFLDSTGYGENSEWKWKKEMTHQPDFNKWSYFAFAGHGWEHIIDISYENDTVVINDTKYSVPPPCNGSDCRAHSAPNRRIIIYYIPYIGKPIKFTEVAKYIGENEY